MKLTQPLIALDQFINTLVRIDGDGWGMADETLSARAWRLRKTNGGARAVKIIDTLFFWQPAHCYNSYLSEVVRSQLPKYYREQGTENG